MRGDSLRDLYAKTLAVIGLGLLAGAGAIVDYWPIGGPLPVVQRADVPRPTAVAFVQPLDRAIPAPVFKRAPARPAIHARNVGTAIFLKASFGPVPADILSERPAAETPPAPEPMPVPDAILVATVEPLLVLGALPQSRGALLGEAPPAPLAPTGFLTGALRKTKESIVRTSAAAGSSIVDVFRGAFGAIKKVTPF